MLDRLRRFGLKWGKKDPLPYNPKDWRTWGTWKFVNQKPKKD